MPTEFKNIRIIGLRSQIKIAFEQLLSSFSFVRRHKQYWMLLIPAVFSLLLSGGLVLGAANFLPMLKGSLLGWLPFDEWSARAGGTIERIIGVLFFIAASAGIVVAYLSVYKFVILTVLAPFFAMISERVEEIETGRTYDFSWPKLVKDSIRGIKVSAINFLKEISMILVLFLLGFVPGLGFLVAPLIFSVQSYFMGGSMIDYYLERREFTAKESRLALAKLKGLSLSIGGFFNLLLFVPLLGVLIAPPLAVIAATRAMIAMEQKEA